MPLIKLITSYLDYPAGKEIDQDKEKCDQLVSLGRAEYFKEVKQAKYENKMMLSGCTCDRCGKSFKSERGLKIHKSRFCK